MDVSGTIMDLKDDVRSAVSLPLRQTETDLRLLLREFQKQGLVLIHLQASVTDRDAIARRFNVSRGTIEVPGDDEVTVRRGERRLATAGCSEIGTAHGRLLQEADGLDVERVSSVWID